MDFFLEVQNRAFGYGARALGYFGDAGFEALAEFGVGKFVDQRRRGQASLAFA